MDENTKKMELQFHEHTPSAEEDNVINLKALEQMVRLFCQFKQMCLLLKFFFFLP